MTAIPASLPDPGEEFYTTYETGLLPRVMTRTVEDWVSSGRIPQDQFIRTPGGRIRIRGGYVRALLAGDSR
jgi:hypothetical protein